MTIDWWTIGIQTVNVAVLIWLLQRFFWVPVSAMIQQRRTTAEGMLTEAEGKRKDAAAALADVERTRAGFAAEGESIRTAAHAAAEQDRTALLAGAAKEAACLQAAARASIEKERDAADVAFADRASRLAVEIAKHLVARLDVPIAQAAFLEGLLSAIKALPDVARQATGASGATVDVSSATPIPPTDQDRCRREIGEALGGSPQIVFRVDPALIAGLELRGPNLVVTNSWRADLTQITADLTYDKRH